MSDKKEKKISAKKINPSKYIELNPTVSHNNAIGEEVTDGDYLEEKIRPLSYSERIKRAQTMRRYAKRIEMAKERAAMRRASPEKIRARARKRALEIIRARILKNKQYAELSSAEKQALDKRLMSVPDTVISRIARKITPAVKKADAERLQQRYHHQVSTSASATGHRSTTNEQFESRFTQTGIDSLFEQFIGGIDTFPKHNGPASYNMSRAHSVVDEAIDFMHLIESTFVNRAKLAIDAEKKADAMRHSRMLATAKRADIMKKLREKPMYEASDLIKRLAVRELERKKLFSALHDYNQSTSDMKYASTKEIEKAAKTALSNHQISGFTYVDLISLHNRIANARSYRKAFDVFDAMESTDHVTDTPYGREWGTDSLTDTYKKATPGQTVEEQSEDNWYNIRQRRKKNLLRLRHNERNYSETLDTNMYEGSEYVIENDESCMIITPAHMKAFEQFVDKMFEKFNIDFDFTKHFRERISDTRNDPCISLKEIADTIKKIYNKYKHGENTLSKYIDAEVVLKDLQNDLNMPIAIEYDRKNDEIEVVAKTIMRKKNFRTPNPEIKL